MLGHAHSAISATTRKRREAPGVTPLELRLGCVPFFETSQMIARRRSVLYGFITRPYVVHGRGAMPGSGADFGLAGVCESALGRMSGSLVTAQNFTNCSALPRVARVLSFSSFQTKDKVTYYCDWGSLYFTPVRQQALTSTTSPLLAAARWTLVVRTARQTRCLTPPARVRFLLIVSP